MMQVRAVSCVCMQTAKAVLKAIAPPVLVSAWRRLRPATPGVQFEGPFASFAEAAAHADGWDVSVITEKALAAAARVRDGLAAFEQDGIAYDRIVYSPTILAFLLLAASRRDALNIIDVGGGLGSNYFQNHKLVGSLGMPVTWNILERPILAELGRAHFATAELGFFDDISQLPNANGVLFTSSLQYIAEPFSALERAITLAPLIALDRVLVGRSDRHAAFVQRPDPVAHYPATYAVWMFARNGLIDWFAEHGFRLVEYFPDDPRRAFEHCGMLFAR